MNFNQLCKSDLCKVVFFCVVAYLVWHFLLKRVVREGITGNTRSKWFTPCKSYTTESECKVSCDWQGALPQGKGCVNLNYPVGSIGA